jgi:RNA polymerase sigma-70 factor, ECF subfamily
MQERIPSGNAPSAEHDLDLAQELAPLLYHELRRVAHGVHLRLCGRQTRSTSKVLHEAYSPLADEHGAGSYENFLRVVAIAVHRILIDRVRSQRAARRSAGAGRGQVPSAAITDFTVDDDAEVLALHEALDSLSAVDPGLFDVAECHIFACYSEPEIAKALGISVDVARHDWAAARAWLRKEMAA